MYEMERNEKGRILSDARHRAGLSQVAVGRHLGIDHSAISAWERGRCGPNREHIRELKELYKLQKWELERLCPRRNSHFTLDQRNEIVEASVNVARWVIQRNWVMFKATGACLEDVLQDLLERMIRAVDTFDPRCGATIQTHIINAMKYASINSATAARNRGVTHVPAGERLFIRSLEEMAEAGEILQDERRF